MNIVASVVLFAVISFIALVILSFFVFSSNFKNKKENGNKR